MPRHDSRAGLGCGMIRFMLCYKKAVAMSGQAGSECRTQEYNYAWLFEQTQLWSMKYENRGFARLSLLEEVSHESVDYITSGHTGSAGVAKS